MYLSFYFLAFLLLGHWLQDFAFLPFTLALHVFIVYSFFGAPWFHLFYVVTIVLLAPI